MGKSSKRKWILWSSFLFAIILVFTLVALNPFLTRYVEGNTFREMISRQTSRALKVNGEYESINRTGLFSVKTEGFDGKTGERTIKNLEARHITATFNPLGIFLKRWQVDTIQIQHGVVELQKTEPKPEPPKPERPWYGFLLPNRIYLKEVRAETADVLWRFRGKKAGIYDLNLLVTPHDRDFEYDGTQGILKMPFVPEMRVDHVHALITKERFFLDETTLSPLKQKKGDIVLKGEAGLRDDLSLTCSINANEMPLSEWMPDHLQKSIQGRVNASIDWKGWSTKLAKSEASGNLKIAQGQISNLPALEKLASLTGKESLKEISIDHCSMNLKWKAPHLSIQNIIIEAKGIFRIEGSINIERQKIQGQVEFGTTKRYLEWLPKAEEQVFTRKRDGYLWTPVHLSGTVKDPKEDLSPRLIETLQESPIAFLGVLFNQIGDWIGDLFDGDE
jgi:hypothetical protein